MEGKKSFVLYTDLLELVEELTDDEAGLLFKTILRYVNDLNPEIPKEIKLAFIPIKQDLKRDLKKYNEQVERINRINAERKRKKEEQTRNDIVTTSYEVEGVNVNVNVNDNDNDNVLSKDNENNNSIINNTCSNQALNECKNDTKFDTFWKAYPRKTGKQKCLNWFKIHKPDDALVQKMVQTIEAFKKSNQWRDPQYIPYPYTWLNRGGWDDELEVKKNQPKAAQEEIIWDTL